MWKDKNNKKYNTIKDFPSKAIGFIYIIEFDNGSKYIGRKELYSTRTVAPKKNGQLREGGVTLKRRKEGKLIPIEKVTKESDWFDYKGSSRYCVSLTPVSKTILAIATNKLELTYLETRELFSNKVLEKDSIYLNENILGKFYKGRFDNIKDL